MTPDHIELRAFGLTLTLQAPAQDFLRHDSQWRMRTHYEPSMATRSLAPEGLAFDIGAGFGSFAVPFALAYPGWTVVAFEPDPQAFAALTANATRLGAVNLIALPIAVGPADLHPEDPDLAAEHLAAALEGDAQAALALADALPKAAFARHSNDHGFMQPGGLPNDDFHAVQLPSLSTDILENLSPQLVKVTAPQMERAIFWALRDAPLDHILGERWSHVEHGLVCAARRPGLRETWLPQTGPGLVGTRRSIAPSPLRPGLDVVVALYNQRAYIHACVEALLAKTEPDLRVLVVDDGSTDDSLRILRQGFDGHPRLKILSKANGGCASARNYGRMMSDASHIAFVDADDLPDAGLFPGLLELGRQTGAEMVQGGFHLLEDGVVTPSIEAADPMLIHAFRHPFGHDSCCLMPAALLVTGQPTIWRRVYRRDFLDSKNIWFPEHIRAFDDLYFHLMTLQSVVNVPVLDGVSYGYRQHPAQDIKLKDEKHFYGLEMFRMAFQRGIASGWADFGPVLQSYVNTVNWVTQGLRPDLVAPYCEGAAELWVMAGKALDHPVLSGVPGFGHPDMPALIARIRAKLEGLPQSAAYVFLDSVRWQAPLVRAPWG